MPETVTSGYAVGLSFHCFHRIKYSRSSFRWPHLTSVTSENSEQLFPKTETIILTIFNENIFTLLTNFLHSEECEHIRNMQIVKIYHYFSISLHILNTQTNGTQHKSTVKPALKLEGCIPWSIHSITRFKSAKKK